MALADARQVATACPESPAEIRRREEGRRAARGDALRPRQRRVRAAGTGAGGAAAPVEPPRTPRGERRVPSAAGIGAICVRPVHKGRRKRRQASRTRGGESEGDAEEDAGAVEASGARARQALAAAGRRRGQERAWARRRDLQVVLWLAGALLAPPPSLPY